MRSRRVQLRTAWLGLMIMLMLVLMPLASQSLAAARTVAALQIIADDLCVTVDGYASEPIEHSDHSDPLAACGYCDLLFNHAALPSVPLAALTPMTLNVAAPLPTRRHIALGVFLSGQPRAPPILS